MESKDIKEAFDLLRAEFKLLPIPPLYTAKFFAPLNQIEMLLMRKVEHEKAEESDKK